MNEQKNKEKANGKNDYYFPVILSQLFCCTAVVMLFLFSVSTADADNIKSIYAGLLDEDYLSVELDSAVSGIKDYLTSSTSFAVFGNRVEPYTEQYNSEGEASFSKETVTVTESQTAQELLTTEAVTEDTTDAVTDELTEPAVLTGAVFSLAEKQEPVAPLKLSYKREQKMISPVYEGRYTSYFGERTDPITEGSDFHKGIDIGADEGDRIRAVLDGRVISTGEDERSGKYIFIKHENNTVTFYCHCSRVILQKGDSVKQGETIAYVGSTGYSTGPHLHFEVRVNNVSVDPLPLIENAD